MPMGLVDGNRGEAMPAFPRRATGEGGKHKRSRVPLSRRFTYRYALALFFFVITAVFWMVTINGASQRISDLSRHESAVAQQLTRVTRINDLATRITTELDPPIDPETGQPATRSPDSSKNVANMASALAQESTALVQVQKGLNNGDASLNPSLPKLALDPRLDQLFNQPDRLNNTVEELGGQGHSLAQDLLGPDKTQERITVLRAMSLRVDDATKGLTKALDYYTKDINAEIETMQTNNAVFIAWTLLMTVAVTLVLFRPMARNIHLETSQLEDAERVHRENNERQTFRNDLSHALEVTDSEGAVLAAVGRAFTQVIPDNKVELLLTDTSQTHLRTVQVSPENGGCGCPVVSPTGCAAIRRVQSQVYESSRMLNVCPKLPEHEMGACSAVCVPVMFNGSALGVLHTTGPDGQPPSHTEIERLSVLASETGNRLGLLRHSLDTELQATTDGLTGLFNRRTVDSKAQSMLLDHQGFSVAMADLDKFKNLNDTHGHEAGDRALRTFAGVLRASLRPEDIPARYGGEEFIVLLPNTGVNDAFRALERLQEALALEVGKAGAIAFTASWGLTDSSAGSGFEQIVAAADAALYTAKRQGRNCIVIAGSGEDVATARPPAPDLPPVGAGPAVPPVAAVKPVRAAKPVPATPAASTVAGAPASPMDLEMERLEAEIQRSPEQST